MTTPLTLRSISDFRDTWLEDFFYMDVHMEKSRQR